MYFSINFVLYVHIPLCLLKLMYVDWGFPSVSSPLIQKIKYIFTVKMC